jgi:glycosyltransferase involved in cell wall biosynthesis
MCLLAMADCLIAQTKVEADYLIQQGITSNRVAIVGAGIDPATLHGGNGAAFRRRHGIRGPMITAIGPQTFDKGAIHLLQAAVRLWRGGRDFTLVLAGPIMADFQRHWRQLPAEDKARCRLLGPVAEAEKRDLLAAADVLALPSRTESFGIVLLEAWFYGKPVIGAQAGAIPAVVEDGINGRLVPFGNVPALAEAVTEVLDDPLQAQRWGANGRQKTIENYTWQAVYERFSAAVAHLA